MTMLGAHGPGRPNVSLVDQYGNPIGTSADGQAVLALSVSDIRVLSALEDILLELRELKELVMEAL